MCPYICKQNLSNRQCSGSCGEEDGNQQMSGENNCYACKNFENQQSNESDRNIKIQLPVEGAKLLATKHHV